MAVSPSPSAATGAVSGGDVRKSVRPSRRAVVGGGVAAALWPLGGEAFAATSPSVLEAAPMRLALAPPPAGPAAALGYSGAIPGPLLRLGRGAELRLKFTNGLDEATTLSFPGLRAANAAAGVGGLTQERIKAGASADIRFVAPDAGFNLYLPHAGASDAAQQGRGLFGPIIVDETVKPGVDLDAAVILSDWSRRRPRPDQVMISPIYQ